MSEGVCAKDAPRVSRTIDDPKQGNASTHAREPSRDRRLLIWEDGTLEWLHHCDALDADGELIRKSPGDPVVAARLARAVRNMVLPEGHLNAVNRALFRIAKPLSCPESEARCANRVLRNRSGH